MRQTYANSLVISSSGLNSGTLTVQHNTTTGTLVVSDGVDVNTGGVQALVNGATITSR